jgi:protein CpxP
LAGLHRQAVAKIAPIIAAEVRENAMLARRVDRRQTPAAPEWLGCRNADRGSGRSQIFTCRTSSRNGSAPKYVHRQSAFRAKPDDFLEMENMNTDTKTAAAPAARSRRWIIAGLAAATLGVAGTSLAWHNRADAHGMGRGFGFGAGPVDPAAMGKRIDAMVQWMLADIDATDDQRARIATIVKAAANDLAAMRGKHLAARRKTIELLAAPTIDRAQIEAVRVEQMQLADNATRRMTQALEDAAEVLTPDQRAKLATKWEQRRGHRHG